MKYTENHPQYQQAFAKLYRVDPKMAEKIDALPTTALKKILLFDKELRKAGKC
jgi:hypothetical protein